MKEIIGKTISHYKILEKVGQGGMGVVYKAEDIELDRLVALKFLPHRIAASEEDRERFKIEARAAAALNHPNIATIHSIEEDDDELFIVMEYIEGRELKEQVASCQLPVEKVMDIATQIASGLQAAHKKGVTHRDIKSSNIMITEEGQVKIMDFGLAKVRGSVQLTKVGTTLGTAAYMSPEQARGESVDYRSDIWSFGVVLYEMLTGQLPFKGDYEQAVIYSILNDEPELMTELAPEVEKIVMKALAKDPDDRYQTSDEVAHDLQKIGGERSEKIKTLSKPAQLPWLVAAVIVVLTGGGLYFFKSVSEPISEKEIIKTIAVLPFVNMSSDPEQEYFSDGLSEELLNTLAKNPKLRVTSRTSSFSFKGKNVDIKTIAAKLYVNNILEGSVRKSGNKLRITAQLIDVETDAHLWSNIYNGTLENIFSLQDSISRSVAKALNITLLGKETVSKQMKTDPEAYNAYLFGKHYYSLYSKENLEKAAGYYEQALSIDPNYTPAWVGLSSVHSAQIGHGYMSMDEGYRKARREVERALELDPNFAYAHSQMGVIKTRYDWDWIGADESFQQALALESGNVAVIFGAANLASTLGRFEEAVTLIRRLIEINPVSAASYYNLGMFALYAGYLEEAETAYRKSLELNPQFPGTHMGIFLVYLEKKKPDSALAEIKRESDPLWQMYGFALVYNALGKKKEADSVLAAFIKEYQNDWAFQIAEIYAYRGNKDKAFEWLERAYDQRDGGLSEIKGDPLLRNIKKDPRYVAFLKKMKLPL